MHICLIKLIILQFYLWAQACTESFLSVDLFIRFLVGIIGLTFPLTHEMNLLMCCG